MPVFVHIKQILLLGLIFKKIKPGFTQKILYGYTFVTIVLYNKEENHSKRKRQNDMKYKNKLYFLSALILTLLLSGLRTACFLTAYETNVGYFANTPTVLITRILYILAATWCLAAPFLLPKETLSETTNLARNICGKLAGSLFLFSGLCLLISTANGHSVLRILIGIFAILTSFFFITDGAPAQKRRTAHAALGFAALAFLFALLFYVYFDMYVTINSPIKNAMQLSVLSAMLFLLCEIRENISETTSRLSYSIKLLCALFCLPTAVSHLIFERSSLCGALERELLSPFFSMALLGIGIFALATFPFYKNEKNF